MTYYRGGFDVHHQPDQTPVTQADVSRAGITRILDGPFRLRDSSGKSRGEPRRPLDHRPHRRDQELSPDPIWAVLIRWRTWAITTVSC